MIIEDYVSFETAKLLRDKGFDKDWVDGSIEKYLKRTEGYSLPTLAVTMKWLRDVHKVNIEIHYNRFGENYKYLIIYKPEVLDDIRSFGVFYSYEETVEAAIKYCLENLI